MRTVNRKAILAAFDMLCYLLTAGAVYVMSKITSSWPSVDDLKTYITNTVILFVFTFSLRLIIGTYNMVWRYSSTAAYLGIVVADAVSTVASIITARIVGPNMGFWFFTIVASLNLLLALSSRYCYRLLYREHNKSKGENNSHDKKKVCIVGAGQLGVCLANELKSTSFSVYEPIFFVDIDISKIGGKIVGIPVYSEEKSEDMIKEHKIEEVIVAIQNIESEKLAELRDYYTELGYPVKIYGRSSFEDADDEGKLVVRDFSIEDLLFRKPRSIVSEETVNYYKDKVIIITGGGGSIGSELCRQVAKCAPKKLIIFDIYENNAYEIEQELGKIYGDKLELFVEIGSVRDVKRLEYVFNKYRPSIVFHAAAHKHVPLMEHSCTEAVKNNVMGTYNTANAAEKYGAEKFILISTDKAVNPTNIMGASKRLCEMLVQCREDGSTKFAAVRFGNVLGSNGSVVPLFKKQIENGGPVTITDKRIIRYFMTIPEASQLVMTAGALANKNELFVLDMGKPVKIYDLAANMIKLSGLIPDKDIEIKEIGLRPGEKLYEELLIKTEKFDGTSHELIFVEKDTPLTREELEHIVSELEAAVNMYESENQEDAVKTAMKRFVKTFKNPEDVNLSAESTDEMKSTDNKQS